MQNYNEQFEFHEGSSYLFNDFKLTHTADCTEYHQPLTSPDKKAFVTRCSKWLIEYSNKSESLTWDYGFGLIKPLQFKVDNSAFEMQIVKSGEPSIYKVVKL